MQVADGQIEIDRFIEKCKQHNLKITPQRDAIYREVIHSKNHPSVDDVFRAIKIKFPNISFDTVNRTLLTFSQIGIVKVVESYRGVRRFDPNLDNHHHLHCIQCGKIIDFKDEIYDRIKVPTQFQEDFIILNKRVVLSGICQACQKEN